MNDFSNLDDLGNLRSTDQVAAVRSSNTGRATVGSLGPAKATNTDVDAETDDTKFMTVAKTFRAIGRKVKAATKTGAGLTEIATNAEIDTVGGSTPGSEPSQAADYRVAHLHGIRRMIEAVVPAWARAANAPSGTGGEANVQSNWTETDTSDDSYIQNKPTNGRIGEIAFKNPPNNLTLTEQDTVRDYISAASEQEALSAAVLARQNKSLIDKLSDDAISDAEYEDLTLDQERAGFGIQISTTASGFTARNYVIGPIDLPASGSSVYFSIRVPVDHDPDDVVIRIRNSSDTVLFTYPFDTLKWLALDHGADNVDGTRSYILANASDQPLQRTIAQDDDDVNMQVSNRHIDVGVHPSHILQDGATAGQVLAWNATNQEWEPATATGGGGGSGISQTAADARYIRNRAGLSNVTPAAADAIPIFDASDSNNAKRASLTAAIIAGLTDDAVLDLAKNNRVAGDRGKFLGVSATDHDDLVLLDAPAGGGGSTSTSDVEIKLVPETSRGTAVATLSTIGSLRFIDADGNNDTRDEAYFTSDKTFVVAVEYDISGAKKEMAAVIRGDELDGYNMQTQGAGPSSLTLGFSGGTATARENLTYTPANGTYSDFRLQLFRMSAAVSTIATGGGISDFSELIRVIDAIPSDNSGYTAGDVIQVSGQDYILSSESANNITGNILDEDFIDSNGWYRRRLVMAYPYFSRHDYGVRMGVGGSFIHNPVDTHSYPILGGIALNYYQYNNRTMLAEFVAFVLKSAYDTEKGSAFTLGNPIRVQLNDGTNESGIEITGIGGIFGSSSVFSGSPVTGTNGGSYLDFEIVRAAQTDSRVVLNTVIEQGRRLVTYYNSQDSVIKGLFDRMIASKAADKNLIVKLYQNATVDEDKRIEGLNISGWTPVHDDLSEGNYQGIVQLNQRTNQQAKYITDLQHSVEPLQNATADLDAGGTVVTAWNGSPATGAGVYYSDTKLDLAAVRAVAAASWSTGVNNFDAHRAGYFYGRLPHAEDPHLYSAVFSHSLRGSGLPRRFLFSQLWNMGNDSTGSTWKYYGYWAHGDQQRLFPDAATVSINRASATSHRGQTRYSGTLTGQGLVTTHPDLTGFYILLTQAQFDALTATVAGKVYIITDAS